VLNYFRQNILRLLQWIDQGNEDLSTCVQVSYVAFDQETMCLQYPCGGAFYPNGAWGVTRKNDLFYNAPKALLP